MSGCPRRTDRRLAEDGAGAIGSSGEPVDHPADERGDGSGAHGRPAERIREALEQAVLLGELARGERLDETRLAERFRVSRTPVREALQLLLAGGLVEHRPHRGVFVRAPDAIELLEMFEVMAELEGLCGRLAARRARVEDLALLGRLADACERALESEDSDHYYRENERLHLALFRLSGNAFLERQAVVLHRRLQPYRRLQLRVPERLRQSMTEHRVILAAIAAGRGEDAARELRAHVAVQGERFNDLLAATAPGERPRRGGGAPHPRLP